MEKENIIKIHEATIGTKYLVSFWKNLCNYPHQPLIRNNDLSDIATEELIVDNINGLGIGQVYFINDKNQIILLPWCAIISMIPINEKVKNYDEPLDI